MEQDISWIHDRLLDYNKVLRNVFGDETFKKWDFYCHCEDPDLSAARQVKSGDEAISTKN